MTRTIEREILAATRELGIGIAACGVPSRGLISGHWTRESGASGRDFRTMSPRFQGENRDRNLALVEALRDIALLDATARFHNPPMPGNGPIPASMPPMSASGRSSAPVSACRAERDRHH